jgi:NADPH-dependent curcumin reductase CurA
MTRNRFWQLNSHPEGTDFEAALTLETGVIPNPEEGQVLIKNNYLSLDAGTRMWMTPRTDGYQPPLPLGTMMVGLCIGTVVTSRHPDFSAGDTVRAFGQWADYSCVIPDMTGLVKVATDIADIRQHFGVLGMNGWTAHWGLHETAKIKTGEAVLVSAAAGSTGILACQIAKNAGCRVYGLAGSDEKCRYLENTVGIDRAFNYKTDDLDAEFTKIDGGINVYFDNVGGAILDSVFPNMALYGRVALCGLIAEYTADGPKGPQRFDQILMKRLTVTGFFSPDFMDQGPRLTQELRSILEAGDIFIPFDETQGLEDMLQAYRKLFTGGNIGKVVLKL